MIESICADDLRSLLMTKPRTLAEDKEQGTDKDSILFARALVTLSLVRMCLKFGLKELSHGILSYFNHIKKNL